MASLYGGKVTKVEVDEQGIAEFLQQNKDFRDMLVHTAQEVQAAAAATAQAAQNGPGGSLYGYAEAGFSVVWESRGGKRPRVNIVSNADPEMSLRVHFYTQKRDGVGHLRAALKTVTKG